MSMYDVTKIKIQRMNVMVSSKVKQKQQITCKADVAGSSFGKYFVAHDADGGNHAFYLDDIAVVDEAQFLKPALPSEGWTEHRVAIASGASGTAIATAIKNAMNLVVGKFVATSTGRFVEYELGALGYAHPGRDSMVAAKKTGFGFKVISLGFSRTSIGAIEGDIEIAGLEQATKAIQIHQEGETELAKVVTGYTNPTLTFNQFETAKESIERALLMVGGQGILPEFEDSESIVGYGPTLLGAQKPQFRVELVPAGPDVDETDKSGWWTIWKADFNLEKFMFGRTEFSTIPMTATMYPEKSLPPAVQFFAPGDVSKLEPAA
nr:hypothetical protein CKG001_10170 [Bdellovibrio sp. CKG001]